MDDNNKLIPLQQNGLIPKVTKTLNITNKLIFENNRKLVMEIFERNPELFIHLISGLHPCDKTLISKHIHKWHWKLLTYNKNIIWTNKMIKIYENKFDWALLTNKMVNWSIELIKQFENKWDWEELSTNEFIPWSIDLIKQFENKWDWEELSTNEFIPWSIELIEKYENKWNWGELSVNESLCWSIELIEKYKSKWIWDQELSEYFNDDTGYLRIVTVLKDEAETSLSGLNNIPWSIELIEKFENEWHWFKLSSNKSLPWSIELIERFKDKWDWEELCKNTSIRWTKKLMKYFKRRVDFNGLFLNESIVWSLKKIQIFLKDEDFLSVFKSYKNFPWIVLFDEFYDDTFNDDDWEKWNHYNRRIPEYEINNSIYERKCFYDLYKKILNKGELQNFVFSGLSTSNELKWSIKLIEKFENRWNWKFLSKNESIPWTIELIDKFFKKWDLGGLSMNKKIPWNIELIEKYSVIYKKWYMDEKYFDHRTPQSPRIENDRWFFRSLSNSLTISWSSELIDRYIDKWEWYILSSNTALPWSIELIERYKNKWFWNELSCNNYIPWTIELIEKNKDKWNWKHLSMKHSLPWSINFIHKFAENLTISTKIWETLQPYIDDEMIEEIFTKINKNEI